jgi:hypothetical protein
MEDVKMQKAKEEDRKALEFVISFDAEIPQCDTADGRKRKKSAGEPVIERWRGFRRKNPFFSLPKRELSRLF